MDGWSFAAWAVAVVVGFFLAWLVAVLARDWWHRPVTDELERIAGILERRPLQ